VAAESLRLYLLASSPLHLPETCLKSPHIRRRRDGISPTAASPFDRINTPQSLDMVQLRPASETESSTLSRCRNWACLTNATSQTHLKHVQHSCNGRFLGREPALGRALSIVNTPAMAHPQRPSSHREILRACLKHLQRLCDGEHAWRRADLASTRARVTHVNTIAMADNLRSLWLSARNVCGTRVRKRSVPSAPCVSGDRLSGW
jgi:hypothetical protein